METFKAYSSKTFNQKDKKVFPFRQLLSTVVNAFSDFISNNIDNFSESLPNDTVHTFSEFISNNSHTFGVLVKMKKVSIHMKQMILSRTILELT